MCEITVQTLLGIFVAPDEYRFSVLEDDYKGFSRKFGLVLYRDGEEIRVWEHFAEDVQQVLDSVYDMLKLALLYGERGYFSEKRNFISDYCVGDNVPPPREMVLNEARAMYILLEMLESQGVYECELASA